MQIAFYIDATKCVNCKTCEIACKDANDPVAGRSLRRVLSFECGEFPAVLAYNLSIACNHCEKPACVEQCPAGAYSKRPRDGIVVHDAERCIGCRYCTWVCPYGAPQYDAREGRVRKCDLCVEEIDQGNSPVCVLSCPLRAIEVGPLEEIAARPDVSIDVRGLPSPGVTGPSCRYRVRGLWSAGLHPDGLPVRVAGGPSHGVRESAARPGRSSVYRESGSGARGPAGTEAGAP